MKPEVSASPRCFNPRSREGSDRISSAVALVLRSFNPRSREGSDSRQSRTVYCRGCFNPRSREGSDAARRPSKRSTAVSIRAPVKGATP